MSICRSSPFSSRTKSLREKFASKRSYSESFKDPPVSASTAATGATAGGAPPTASELSARASVALPSPSCLMSSGDSGGGMVIPPSMPSFLPTYTVLPEDAYCSALDINSQEGDPRFPWQRDAAVQCDLKSFALPPAAAESSATEGGRSDRPQRSSTAPAAASGSNDFGARIPSNFFAPFGSTCAPTPPPRKSTTTAPVLQRALSLERSATRKKTSTLFSGTGAQGTSQLPTSLEEDSGRGGIYVPHHVQTLTRSPEGGSPPSDRKSVV